MIGEDYLLTAFIVALTALIIVRIIDKFKS